MADGIVLVSHSVEIVQGLEALIKEVAKDVPLTKAGGLEDSSIGTSFDRILAAVEGNGADRLLTFFDLGSARMNLEMVAEMAEKELLIYSVPLIEGAYVAAALLQAGADLKTIEAELEKLKIEK